MIVGRGNIAKVLVDREDLVFFASGVSDSSCISNEDYNREISMVKNIDPASHVVYFSNLGVYYKDDRYTRHKKYMENLVKSRFKYYTIIRIEVCEWVNNPTTILNVFKQKLANGEKIEIQNAYRYVLSLDEFLYWIKLIPKNENNEMNILGRRMHVSDILEAIKNGRL
jgi:hypothetical protein